jgi:hypothetical protein
VEGFAQEVINPGLVEDGPELGLLEDAGGYGLQMLAVGTYLANGVNKWVDQLENLGDYGSGYGPESGSYSAPVETGGIYSWQDSASLLLPSVGGSPNPCAMGCYPPPPPQDCYAGPHPTCTPAKAPESLRTAVTITTRVREVTSYKKACRNACVREHLGRPRGPVIRANPGHQQQQPQRPRHRER